MTTQKKISTKTGLVQLRADTALFARLAVLAQQRSMDMAEVLTYPLGPLPGSLANADGSPTKTSKAKLLSLLEDISEPLENVPLDAAWIIDGMALMQSLQEKPATFAELARFALQRIMSRWHIQGGRVDVVFDCYWAVSIKTSERQHRTSYGGLQAIISSRNQKCPRQWKKFCEFSQVLGAGMGK